MAGGVSGTRRVEATLSRALLIRHEAFLKYVDRYAAPLTSSSYRLMAWVSSYC